MKSTSRVSRAVRRAARSPARSMMGPAVALMGDPQLGRDDVGEAGLAHAGGPEEEDVVEGLPAAAGRLDGDPQVRHHLRLAHVLVEGARAEGLVEADVVVAGRARRRGAGRPPAPPARHDLQRAAQEVLEAAGAVVAQGAVDAALRLRPRVAEVGQRGEQVVLRGGLGAAASASGLRRRQRPASCPSARPPGAPPSSCPRRGCG